MTPPERLARWVQKHALPGVWSKGVQLARAGAARWEGGSSDADDEWRLRVSEPGRVAAARVTLWPHGESEDELDAHCDCDGPAEPCPHVAAAAIAAAEPIAPEGSSSRATAVAEAPPPVAVGYELRADPGPPARLRVLRTLGGDPLEGGLAAAIGGRLSGRLAGRPVEATREDLAADAVLVPAGRSVRPNRSLHPDETAALIRALAGGPALRFADATARANPRPFRRRLAVRLGDDGGIRIRLRALPPDARVGESWCVTGGELRPYERPRLDAEFLRPLETEDGTRFSGDFLPDLVADWIPQWRAAGLEVESDGSPLPECSSELRPEVWLQLEGLDSSAGQHLAVTPRLAYGDPPIAEIRAGRLHLLAGPGTPVVPRRDPVAEHRLARRLQQELNLGLDRVATFNGPEALRFRERAAGWKTRGQARDGFRAAGRLTANWDLAGGNFAEGLRASLDFRAEGGVEVPAQAALAAWERGDRHVAVGGDRWFELPADWLARYGDLARAVLEARADAAGVRRIPPALGYQLWRSLTEPEFAGPRGGEAFLARLPEPDRARLLSLAAGAEAPAATAAGAPVRADLRDYQRTGIAWLATRRDLGLGALLADDMGLGKTLQALAVVQGPALVVCPLSVLSAWADQAQRFRPELDVAPFHGPDRRLPSRLHANSLVLTTYGLLRTDLESLVRAGFRTLVFDESQLLRNPDSQSAQAARELSRAPTTRFRLALSGTPLENRVEDLWSQFEVLNPGLLPARETLARQPLEEIRRRTSPFLLRRRKEDVARELPPRTELALECELSEGERELYSALLVGARAELKEGRPLGVLEALLRLRQACCHPALVPGCPPALAARAESAKLSLLLEHLGDAVARGGHRALVFSQWTSLLDRLEPLLARAGIPFLRLDGSTPATERPALVERFQAEDGPPVLLLSLKAGGVGLTLTAADHVYLLDPWWNPATEAQAADRAHRIGQTRAVFIHRLVARETVEERVLLLQAGKRALAEAIVDGSLGPDSGGTGVLDLARSLLED